MKKSSILLKTTSEMFFSQFIWAIYYFVAVVVIYIVLNILFNVNSGIETTTGSFFMYSNDITQMFMLIIGIIAPSFLSYFISNGVTRKNIFKGSVLAAGGLSVIMVLIIGALSGIISFLMNLMNLPVITTSFVSEGGVLGTIGNVFSIFLFYSLYLFVHYLIGWFIGAGFYKFGWLIGIGFVAAAILFASLLEWIGLSLFIWGDLIGDLLPNTVLNMLSNITLFDVLRLDQIFSQSVEFPMIISILGVFGIIALLLWLIRLLTKKVYVDL